MNRRSFLRLIGFGGAAAALPTTTTANATHAALTCHGVPVVMDAEFTLPAWVQVVPRALTLPPGVEVIAVLNNVALTQTGYVKKRRLAPKAPERSEAVNKN